MMGPIETALREAQHRISDPANWVQGQYLTSDGRRCAIGALGVSHVDQIYLPPWVDQLDWLTHELLFFPGYSSVSDVNDRLGHKWVMRLYDAAIKRAAEQGA